MSRATEIAAILEGTAQRLSDLLSPSEIGDNGLLREIDAIVFLCESCDHWLNVGEECDHSLCRECFEQRTEDEEREDAEA